MIILMAFKRLHIFIVEWRDFRDSKESNTEIENIFEEVAVV